MNNTWDSAIQVPRWLKAMGDSEWLKANNEYLKVKHRRIKNMETKSRYEVISDLEKQKRDLIIAKRGLGDRLKQMERALKEQEREVEDQKEEITYFKGQIEEQEKTFDELIKSVDTSLERLTELNKKEQQKK